jgi:Fanconi anemia group M protein
MDQKILTNDKVKVVVDSRESQCNVVKHLANFDVTLSFKQLQVGDYVCSDRVVIERKTVSDFLQSVIDQRIFNQMSDLNECFEKPLLILEGDPNQLFFIRNIHPNTIRGALSSIAIDFRIPIIWTGNSKETAAQVFWIAYREQKKEKRELSIRVGKKVCSLPEQQEFLVAGLPHINSKLSRRLLEKFRTPKAVFNATPERLMKVDGVGKEKSKKIWDLLNKKYEE